MAQIQRLPGILPTQRLREPKKRPGRSFFFLIAVIFFTLTIYWAIFASPVFAVQSVEVVGINNDAVKVVADQLKGKNIFHVHSAQLDQEIKQIIPTVGSVELVRGLPHTIRVMATLRTPVLKWISAGNVFILDSQGLAFEQGDKENYSDLPRITDYSNIPVTVGKRVITPGFIEFVQESTNQVTILFQKKITAFEIHETMFHIDMVLDGDLRIRLTTQRPISEQLESAQKIFVAHPTTHYIDVRVPGVGYYK